MDKGQAVFRTYTTLARCIAALPEPVALGLGNVVGEVLFRVRHEHRAQVAANLARVLGAGADDAVVLDLWARRSFREYARYWVEGARLPGIDPDEVTRHVVADGLHHLHDGVSPPGKGCILALPHIGSWEYGGAFLATQGLPMTAVAERIEPPELFDYFVEPAGGDGAQHRAARQALGRDAARGAAGREARRPAVRPRHRGHRHRGGILRRADDHAGGPGHPRPAHRCHPVHRCRLQRTGPRSPGAGRSTARHHPHRVAPRRRRPGDAGDRHPTRGPDPPGTRAVARLPAVVARRSSRAGGRPGRCDGIRRRPREPWHELGPALPALLAHPSPG